MAYSYCRQRTLGRLRYLFLGVLLLLFGFFLMFFGLFGEEFPERDIMDYLLIIAGALIFFSQTKEPPESADWQPLEVRKAPQRPSGQEPLLLSLWETAAEKNQ